MTIEQIKNLEQEALKAESERNYAQALDLHREALIQAREELNRPVLMAVLLNRVGQVQELTGEIQDAVISYETGLRLLAEDPTLQLGPNLAALIQLNKEFSGSSADLNRVLHSLRGMRKGFRPGGELPNPPELYPQILADDLETAIADPHLALKLLINIGNAYLRQPQEQVAQAVYEQALARPNLATAPQLKAYLLTHLGIIAQRARDLSQAEAYLTEARQLLAQQADPLQQRRALVVLAELYDDRGEVNQALKTYHQALPLYTQAGDPRGEARTRARVGRLLVDQEHFGEAEAYYQQALILAETERDQETPWHIYWGLGRCQRTRGALEEAAQSFDRSLTLIEQRQDELATDQGKVTFVDSVRTIYDALVEIHLQQGDDAAALATAERARGQALIDLMGVRHRRQTFTGNDQVRPTRMVSSDEFGKLVGGWPNAAAGFNPVAQMAIATPVELADGALAEQAHHAFTPARDDGERGAGGEEAASATGTVSAMPRLARLVYHLLPDRTVVFAVTRDGAVQAHSIALTETELTEKVNVLRQALQVDRNPRGVTRDAGFDGVALGPGDHELLLCELYDLLVAPLAGQLPTDGAPVVIEPQGPLWLLPFAALRLPTGTWLAERWPLLYAPSQHTLEEIRSAPDYGDPMDLSVLIVGDPVMPPVPQKYGIFRLGPLAGAAEEAAVLARMFQQERPDHLWLSLMLGRDATEAAVLSQARHHGIIHLATHGLAYADQPLDSFVALAKSDDEDGLLTARQVMDLQLRADLVTLSACQTGLGQISGDGMIGLSRAFLVAGARAVLVSQWSVSDDATVALMTIFYREYLRLDNKALALQQAMRELWTNQETAHPLYWAPFVVVGAEA